MHHKSLLTEMASSKSSSSETCTTNQSAHPIQTSNSKTVVPYSYSGAVAQRALLLSSRRRSNRRRAVNENAKGLPSRLSRVSVADDAAES
ncbi:hypothetical protein QJS10_CPB17g01168 [Acorus calamus]|uniref:Uncharacterized protein n=1 Tax=Acorus calamus TaxID=4465 RepID=A0AAV9CSI8_ACOCL|nr:hypothetical protein QJS10_CPB17g01168 [Acorus calamus]